jgi:hypothetical protein
MQWLQVMFIPSCGSEATKSLNREDRRRGGPDLVYKTNISDHIHITTPHAIPATLDRTAHAQAGRVGFMRHCIAHPECTPQTVCLRLTLYWRLHFWIFDFALLDL